MITWLPAVVSVSGKLSVLVVTLDPVDPHPASMASTNGTTRGFRAFDAGIATSFIHRGEEARRSPPSSLPLSARAASLGANSGDLACPQGGASQFRYSAR